MPIHRVLLFLLPLLLIAVTAQADTPERADQLWYSHADQNQIHVNLSFFWSKKCPHCREAVPFVERLDKKHEWLTVYSRELTEHPENVDQYIAIAAQLGQEARSVPAFLWCGNMLVGYDNPDNMGKFLEQELLKCYEWLKSNSEQSKPEAASILDNPVVTIPILGTLSLNDYSLPAYTIILAGLDAFNPCAFFVLLFLLSLMVHAKSRKRMFIVGGIFVLFSGIRYFLFMTAWLNVFLMMGKINTITIAAGLLAVAIAVINIKDYFWFKQGVSLSIPDSARPTLYQRTRKLVAAGSMPAMIMATVGLATFANLYEFLCTAGFPMVFTRILTMEELPTITYYLYLGLYNIIYVIPLLVIVVVFTMTFGVKKLQEEQGRQLKLLSGMMMLLLGLVLVFVPNWLNSMLVAFSLLLSALMLTAIIVYVDRYRRSVTLQ
jgi:thiol-disulfide isomerase/thioredoxin